MGFVPAPSRMNQYTLIFVSTFVYLICFVYYINSASVALKNETELVLVSVIFRHGARTTYAFYPKDPNINETFYPIGLGGLTNEGKFGEFQLGRYLKKLYGDFLGENYFEDEVYVRSTDVTRTKMSAQLVLAGLFPPSKLQLWNKELMWQPIPVAYKSEEEEDIFHPFKTCPYKLETITHLPEREDIQEKFIRPHEKIYKYIQENSGKNISQPGDVQDFFFILKSESDMNLTLPEWTKNIFPKPLEETAAQVYAYHNYDKRVRLINVGYMLKKILEDSKEKIGGVSKKKMFLYSGHESTMGYMLDALDVVKPHVPPYGSALSFEIHRGVKGQYYMKLRYRNDSKAVEPVDLKIPGCDILCPLDKFEELQKHLLPQISIKEACRIKAKDVATRSTKIRKI